MEHRTAPAVRTEDVPWTPQFRSVRALAAIGAVLALTVTGLLVAVTAVGTDSPPPHRLPSRQTDAGVVTADALPTVQINGVVWSQAVVGNTVYAGGKFTNARPAGAAAGTNQTPRANLLAYDLTTGELITSFAPVLNGQVRVVVASPDGSRLYVGGDFTTINGATRSRIAAFNTADGAGHRFLAAADYNVYAIAATNTTVYIGGDFNNARGVARKKLAAFNAADGALLGWNPGADTKVNALVMTPDGTQGRGRRRVPQPEGKADYGIGRGRRDHRRLDDLERQQPDPRLRRQSAILGLSTDGTNIYGNGYVYGGSGNLEGAFSADPADGNIKWIEDCHGDSYGTYAPSNAPTRSTWSATRTTAATSAATRRPTRGRSSAAWPSPRAPPAP